jgi:adenine C2-methylase RlmN of 23S rRNA A2503 and tRNA A37
MSWLLAHQCTAAPGAQPAPRWLQVFVEYVVLRGVNDNLEQAHELGQLLQGKDVVVNLIPWNPVYSPDGPAFEAPDADRVTEFQATVRGQYGVHCTVRQEKGQDISGACGQLVVEHNLSKASSCGQQTGGGAGAAGGASGGVKDIEELGAAVTKMVC